MAKPFELHLFGDDELLRMFDKLKISTARQAMREGARAAAELAEKKMKRNIPSQHKGIKAALGSRRLGYRDAPGGGAKVGANVAISKKRRTLHHTGDRNKKGVGITSSNIWWWYRGSYKTPNRKTGKRGGPVRRTGRMPPQDNALDLLRKHKSALKKEWQRVSAKVIKIEIAKGF
jgi:hypothetical protein